MNITSTEMNEPQMNKKFRANIEHRTWNVLKLILDLDKLKGSN